MQKKLKLSQAFFWIILSTIIFSSFNFFVFFQIKKYKQNKYKDEKYNIKKIYQSNQVSLDVNYLSELMHLSTDNPTNIFLFDEVKAQKKLLSSPLIIDANIKKNKPDCLSLDLKIRHPKALLYDYDNIAIDEEGFIFFLKPFFNNLDLPSVYLDLGRFSGLKKIEKKEATLALDILQKLQTSGFSDLAKIKLLDTSRAFIRSYGKREVLLQIDEQINAYKDQKNVKLVFPTILRLSQNNLLEQISNYISLREKILKDYENQLKHISDPSQDVVTFKPKTIDLRISKLAFIDQ
ncbi:MAG: hypothetical protein K940chlam1_00005 [Candidatus Anoxychlamydiales bacterium]|nr:hypothetical protein [Candidatus Anoxychlamydiales bacterium]NGX35822.1 hypothetical protein [Candidatus Anoxychlamydiales bacterium]